MNAPITISEVTSLSKQRSFNFFGGDIPFNCTEIITLQCAKNAVSIGSMANAINLRKGEGYASLIVVVDGDSVDYGEVRLESFGTDGDDWVDTNFYTISFSRKVATEDLSTLSGYWSDLAVFFNTTPEEILEDFSETIGISGGPNSRSFTRTLSIKFNDSIPLFSPPPSSSGQFADTSFLGAPSTQSSLNLTFGTEDLVRLAIKSTLNYIDSNGYDHFPRYSDNSDIMNKLFYSEKTESVDAINNSITFSETKTAENIESSVSHSQKTSISVNKQGVSVLTVSGTIKGMKFSSGYVDAGNYLASILATQIPSKMNTIYSQYGNSSRPLNSSITGNFTSKSIVKNPRDRTISYTVTSDNDPRRENSDVYYENFITIEEVGCYVESDIRGVIRGLSGKRFVPSANTWIDKFPRYAKASEFYGTIKSDINTIGRFHAGMDNDNIPIAREESHSLYAGEISFSRRFSNNPIYSRNYGEDAVKKITLSTERTMKTPRHNEFKIYQSTDIAQRINGQSYEQWSDSASIVGYRINPWGEAVGAKTTFLSIIAEEVSQRMKTLSLSHEYSYANNVSFSTKITQLGSFEDSCS